MPLIRETLHYFHLIYNIFFKAQEAKAGENI